ncbi:MAG: DUF1761 domain-containing protein [Spirochaeta sp.]
MFAINIWAVIVAAIVYFIIGAFWYSPVLFGRLWAQLKYGELDSNKEGPTWQIMLGAFTSGLVLSAALSMIATLSGAVGILEVMMLGITAWLGFTAAPQFANVLFGGDIRVWLIDAGYPLVAVIVISMIIGAWV